MKNKIIIPTILFIAVLIFSISILAENKREHPDTPKVEPIQEQETAKQEQIILYYGEGCPHCLQVEKYLSENKIKDKISFQEKEVYHDQKNANELVEKAKICGLLTDQIGVPFLWDGKKCYIGDQEIINFFKQKINGQ